MQLSHHYAEALPELVTATRAEEQPDPELVILNEPLAHELGLDPDWLRSPDGVTFLTGAGGGYAMAYSGHQFGHFSPRLGDGRAMLLGEVTTPDGQLRDIHVKGSGATPYSRAADGRGTLTSMLREFLFSEAMHAMGVPTTHSLAVLSTGRAILRQAGVEPGGMLVRVAEGHSRVGTMQYARLQGEEVAEKFARYVIARHYPDLAADDFFGLFHSVFDTQLHTVAEWTRIGFVHGVMNTDNTSLTGETIDYGPCAFTDTFDRNAWFSSVDTDGRYRFGYQPSMLGWNMTRFGDALIPLIDVEAAQDLLNGFRDEWAAVRRASTARILDVDESSELIDAYQAYLDATQPDITRLHRGLVDAARGDLTSLKHLEPWPEWLKEWVNMDHDAAALAQLHPVYIPRNHLVDGALRDARFGNLEPYEELLTAVTNPFLPVAGLDNLSAGAPEDFGPFITYCGT